MVSDGCNVHAFEYWLMIIVIWFFQILEEEKVHNLLTIGEYPLYFVPLDEDVLSFELDLAYKVGNFFILNLWIYFSISVKLFDMIWFVFINYFFGGCMVGMPSWWRYKLTLAYCKSHSQAWGYRKYIQNSVQLSYV